jgi:hypothetical protein
VAFSLLPLSPHVTNWAWFFSADFPSDASMVVHQDARTPVPFHIFSEGATPSFHAGSHKRLPPLFLRVSKSIWLPDPKHRREMLYPKADHRCEDSEILAQLVIKFHS